MRKVPLKVRGGMFMPQVRNYYRRTKSKIVSVEEMLLVRAAGMFCRREITQ